MARKSNILAPGTILTKRKNEGVRRIQKPYRVEVLCEVERDIWEVQNDRGRIELVNRDELHEWDWDDADFRRNSQTSMTYGVVPSFKEFSAHLDSYEDNNGEQASWDERGYPMVLVGSDVDQAEKALRKMARANRVSDLEFFTERGKYGLRILNKSTLWNFIKALPILTDDPDGDLASSIMTTLGYEWI